MEKDQLRYLYLFSVICTPGTEEKVAKKLGKYTRISDLKNQEFRLTIEKPDGEITPIQVALIEGSCKKNELDIFLEEQKARHIDPRTGEIELTDADPIIYARRASELPEHKVIEDPQSRSDIFKLSGHASILGYTHSKS